MQNNKKHKVNRQLSGNNNKRLHSNVRLNNNYTAAWADAGYVYPETKVTKPCNEQTEQAKDWVDNGSKL